MKPEYKELIQKYAKQFGVDPDIAMKMAEQESGGDKSAESKKGAKGLFQLMPETAKSLGVTDVNDPEQNVKGAMQYMKQLLDSHGGDYRLALASYNAGPGAVKDHAALTDYPETRDYVNKIMPAAQQIDWDKVAATAPADFVSNSGIDWDKVAKAQRLPDSGLKTIGPAPTGVGHWLENAISDIKHGSDITMPGKILKAMGATGTEKGVSPGAADMMGGPFFGPFEAAHGVSELPDHPIRGTNEIFRGVGHTAGPAIAATNPELLPELIPMGTMATGVGTGAQKTASALGADPDTAELAGNIAMVGAPFAKKTLDPLGRFVERHASKVGNTAGYGAGLFKAYSEKNPMWLLGSDPVAKAGTAITGAVGRGMQNFSKAPIFPWERSARPTLFEDPRAQIKPKQLGAGPIQLGAPDVIEPPGPITKPAAAQIVRGPKGRMSKQFLTDTAEPGAKARYPQPIVTPPEGAPAAPPKVLPQFATESTAGAPLKVTGAFPDVPESVGLSTQKVEPGEADAFNQFVGRSEKPTTSNSPHLGKEATRDYWEVMDPETGGRNRGYLEDFKDENEWKKAGIAAGATPPETIQPSLIDSSPVSKTAEPLAPQTGQVPESKGIIQIPNRSGVIDDLDNMVQDTMRQNNAPPPKGQLIQMPSGQEPAANFIGELTKMSESELQGLHGSGAINDEEFNQAIRNRAEPISKEQGQKLLEETLGAQGHDFASENNPDNLIDIGKFNKKVPPKKE